MPADKHSHSQAINHQVELLWEKVQKHTEGPSKPNIQTLQKKNCSKNMANAVGVFNYPNIWKDSSVMFRESSVSSLELACLISKGYTKSSPALKKNLEIFGAHKASEWKKRHPLYLASQRYIDLAYIYQECFISD